MFSATAVSVAAENNLTTIGFVFTLHCSTITDGKSAEKKIKCI